MSMLCGQDIFFIMFDREKQKMYEFNSTEDFDVKVVSKLLSPDTRMQFQYEKYLNTDYGQFINDKGDKSEYTSQFDEFERPLNIQQDSQSSNKINDNQS